MLLGYSRVPYSAALDGNFFPFFAKLHPTKHFPHISLLVLGALAFTFSIALKLETAIAGILAMRLIVQFIGQAVGVMILRKRWGSERLPFKMWLYPLPAVLTMLGWAWLFWQTGPARKYGLMEIALGVAAYMVWARVKGSLAVCRTRSRSASCEAMRRWLSRRMCEAFCCLDGCPFL